MLSVAGGLKMLLLRSAGPSGGGESYFSVFSLLCQRYFVRDGCSELSLELSCVLKSSLVKPLTLYGFDTFISASDIFNCIFSLMMYNFSFIRLIFETFFWYTSTTTIFGLKYYNYLQIQFRVSDNDFPIYFLQK